MDVGLLVVRFVFGLLLAAHGCQKLFGWFGGSGMRGTAMFFESLGFHPGRLFVVLTVLAECGGGILLALGLLQPFATAPILSVMIVAIATVHWGQGLLSPNGIELPLLYLTAALSLALTGPGAHSLDALLGLTPRWTAQTTAIALAMGVLAGLVSLGLRRGVLPWRTRRCCEQHRSIAASGSEPSPLCRESGCMR
jgi:putative oxidoreductase